MIDLLRLGNGDGSLSERKNESMAYTSIIYLTGDHIARITLNRPEADNVINLPLAQELDEVCREINQDDSVYVVVITGAGDKVFCGGSELEQLVRSGSNVADSDISAGMKMNVARAVAGIDRPVIAALNGDALGQGLELALSCDVRLASDRAKFGFPQVALGLIPMDGGTQRLPRLIGQGRALELLLTAETISAGEALSIGLVSKVFSGSDLAAEAEAMARAIAGKAPIALRYVKEAVSKGLDLTLEQGLRLEADLYLLLHTTADRTEGIKAFLEKRPPKFRGR